MQSGVSLIIDFRMTSLPEMKHRNDCGTVLTVYTLSLPRLHLDPHSMKKSV